jgi:hypothetical protein
VAVATAGLCVFLTSGSALAEPAPPPAPVLHSGPASVAPSSAAPWSAPWQGPATGQPQPPAPNDLIDPALLESLQPSIVGLVTIWEEPVDPYAMVAPEAMDPALSPQLPVISICTGWFDTPTTLVTAGHCVDPQEGRMAMHERNGPRDEDGWPLPLDHSLPDPERTVWAFQPRELPGAVLTSPVIVRVDEFRSADDGDTAKLSVYGLPPAKPLAIAPAAPGIGQTVTSFGFPGLNILETDGIDFNALLSGGKNAAEVLQDSRLQSVNTSGTIGSRQYREGVAAYQVNADLGGGMSGGPTVDARGEVLGVNSKMTVPFLGQNFNVITDTGMLRAFLGHDQPQQAPAAPSAAAETTSETSVQPDLAATPAAASSTGWTLGTSLLGGAILGGLAIGGLTRVRRDASATRSDDPADPQPGSAAALP